MGRCALCPRIAARTPRQRTVKQLAPSIALAAALALIAIAALTKNAAALAAGWLLSALSWSHAIVGATTLRLIAKLTGGERQDGAVAALAPLIGAAPWLGLLAVPLAFAARILYPWAQEADSGYFHPLFVLIRTIAALGVWTWLALICRRGPLTERVAALGLVLHAIALTFVGVDWILSLTPRWLTTNFAMTLFSWQMLAAAAGAILAAPRRSKDLRDDFAGILVGALIASAYFAYMSYFVVWYGDIPEAARWYVARAPLPWSWLVVACAITAFASACLLLATRRRKLGAATALLALWLYQAWWIAPVFGATALFAAIAATSLIGAGVVLTMPTRQEAAG